MNIGILAVQGAFFEHAKSLDRLGSSHFYLRKPSDLPESFDGLILPGGESTTMHRLLVVLGLFEPLKHLLESGLPVFGTCAGLLLLAKEIVGPGGTHFRTLDVTAVRNAYGRQLGSFSCLGDMKGLGTIPMVFIRAPYIESVGGSTEVLSVVGGHIVAVREGHQLATAFHPELTADLSVHQFFLDMCQKVKKESF